MRFDVLKGVTNVECIPIRIVDPGKEMLAQIHRMRFEHVGGYWTLFSYIYGDIIRRDDEELLCRAIRYNETHWWTCGVYDEDMEEKVLYLQRLFGNGEYRLLEWFTRRI